MLNPLLCPNGHVWEISEDGEPASTVSFLACPVCGEPCAPSLSDRTTLPLIPGGRGAKQEAPQFPVVPGYDVIGLLGEGGMGKVFKARHLRLDRIVALKMISREQASVVQRARFQIEVTALAKLDHPHIVQIYEVNEHNGVPYFSLEYLEGGSLDRKLAGVPQPPQQAAQLLETLARAIQWAHQQGIIHRDLKPANILLSRDGQPKITDFGLAKQIEQDSHQTRTGDILGTPAYMAPEQAIGKPDSIGPCTDVYALGVILYEMLTGRPPFRGVNAVETIGLILASDPVPPRQLQPSVPSDLETICLKCMEKAPAKRYANGLELADDLNRFLGHQPILARRASWTERVAKWIWRNPALAALVIVVLVSILAFAGLGAWSNTQLRFLAQRADNRSRVARSVVDDLYTQFAEEWLAEEPYQDPVRQEFLEKALRLYQEFAEEDTGDPDLQRETAVAHFRLGQIHRILNQNPRAEKAYRQAIGVQQKLCNQFPLIPQYRQDLANTHNWLGELFRQTEALSDAEANFGKAIELQEELLSAAPRDPAYRKELARSHYNWAIVLIDTSRTDDAAKHLERSISLLGKLHEEFPEVADYRHEWARCFINRGVLHKEKNELVLAEKDYRRAIELLSPLAPVAALPANAAEYRGPIRTVYRADLALAHRNLGNLLWSQGKTDDARAETTQALGILGRLAADFPLRPAYQKSLADTHNSIATIFAVDRKLDDAEKNYDTARQLLDRLVTEHSDVAEYQQVLAITLGNLGWMRSEQKDWQAARKLYEQAIVYLKRIQQANPKNAVSARVLANQYQSLAETSIRLGDHKAAATAAKALSEVGADPAQGYYFAACFFARCLGVAEKDNTITDPAVRVSHAENYTQQSLAMLKKANVAGAIRRLPDEQEIFRPLRDQPEFQHVLADLDRQAKP